MYCRWRKGKTKSPRHEPVCGYCTTVLCGYTVWLCTLQVVNGQNKIMEFHRDTSQWVAHFNSVQLQSVRQPEKINDRLVMENLNGMVFCTALKIRGKEYKLKALSLPMVIISHVLQDCQARAFLIWDAAFSEDVSHTAYYVCIDSCI